MVQRLALNIVERVFVFFQNHKLTKYFPYYDFLCNFLDNIILNYFYICLNIWMHKCDPQSNIQILFKILYIHICCSAHTTQEQSPSKARGGTISQQILEGMKAQLAVLVHYHARVNYVSP